MTDGANVECHVPVFGRRSRSKNSIDSSQGSPRNCGSKSNYKAFRISGAPVCGVED